MYKQMAVMVTAAFSLCGCSYFSGTAETISDAYKAYIDPPAYVDYDDLGDVEDCHKVLGRRMIGIERALTGLERVMMASDTPPTPETAGILLQKFPWLSGIAAVDKSGEVLARQPEFSLKQLDFAPMVEMRGASVSDRKLAGVIQDSPLGAEAMLGAPIFANHDYLGMLVVHFDIRSLLNFSEDPAGLVILTPTAVLWPGKYIIAETPLADITWDELLEDEVTGVLENDRGSFAWVVRYIGGTPLIFAAPAEGTFPEVAQQPGSLPM